MFFQAADPRTPSERRAYVIDGIHMCISSHLLISGRQIQPNELFQANGPSHVGATLTVQTLVTVAYVSSHLPPLGQQSRLVSV